jgi:proline racemase
MAKQGDYVRELVIREPRGHRDMTGALLTEPVSPGSHAGLIFMHGDGYASMAGHAVLGATLLALAHHLVVPGGDGRSVTYDTVAGTVRARAGDRQTVTFTNVPSFVLAGGMAVQAAGRHCRADVAFGGAFYAIVDAESLGLSVSMADLPLLRRMAGDVALGIEAALTVEHPLDRRLRGLAGVLFTAPATGADAHLRNLTVLTGGAAGRSASGTGMSALMAVLDAMGLLDDGGTFVLEGLSGAQLSGRVGGRTAVGDLPALVPEVQGEAWPTGTHHFVADPEDPLGRGLAFADHRS